MAACAPQSAFAAINLSQALTWGRRGAIAVLDQGLTSGTNLVVNLALARWLTASAYGAFAVGFSLFLFLSSFHNGFLLEPLSVLGPSHYADRLAFYFARLIRIHFLSSFLLSFPILIAALVLVWARSGDEVGRALIGAAIALPFILLLWMVRRFFYVLRRPGVAVLGSSSYLAACIVGLLILRVSGRVSPATGFLIIGMASFVSSLPLLAISSPRNPENAATTIPCSAVLGQHWKYGRWLIATAVLSGLAAQIQTILSAGLIGLEAAGAFRAMQVPMLAMTQTITATATLALPAMSYEFGRNDMRALRRKGLMMTFLLTTATVFYEGVLMIFRDPLEHILYGGKFAADAWLIPLLGAVAVFTAFGTGYSLVLRAMQRPQFYLIATAFSAPVALASSLVFTHLWGIGGAALSMVVTCAVSAAVSWYFCATWRVEARA